MSTVTPNAQTRNGHSRDWGNYASLSLLPNATGWVGGVLKATPLEEGDPAYVTGIGRVYCVSPGTPGLLDAVWSATGTPAVTVVEVDFTGPRPVYEAEFTILDARVAPSTVIVVTQSGATATDRVGNDLAWDQLLLGAVAGTGEFTLTALATPGPVTGKRVILYQLF